MTRTIEGWGPIATHLSKRLQVDVTAEAARWYGRKGDLPVKRLRLGKRPRVTADPDALNEWCDARAAA